MLTVLHSCFVKISYKDISDLFEQINQEQFARIESIKPTMPDRTDTNHWAGVFGYKNGCL